MTRPAHDAPRVLYLTHRVPFPPDKGDRIRNYHVLRQLARRARVWLLALADEPVAPAARAELDALCERVAVVPSTGVFRWVRAALSAAGGRSLSEGALHEPAADQVLREWGREANFTSTVASASSLAPYLRRNGLECVPTVVDVVDVDSRKWLDFAAASRGPWRWLYRFEAARIRRLEADLPRWAKAVTLVSEAEAAAYDAVAGQGTATVATNGVDLDYFEQDPDYPSETACAFVGALDYLPNVDASVWFATHVWPEVHRQRPDAEFWVIGRNPAPAVRRLARLPGVRVVGPVPDVRPHLARAAVAVAPMRLGRGLQNKVLEALAMGKAVVASPPALAALAATPGRDLLRARTSTEWVRAVCELLDTPARRRELGECGRRYVEEHHDWERCLSPLVDGVLDPAPTPAAAGTPCRVAP